jgi:general secretion pathway protein D
VEKAFFLLQATIEIAEEISVSTGVFEVETISGVTLKDAFSRAQYGIKIDVIPTIHAQEEGEDEDYVTLATDITFQTFAPALDNRPDVTTRHIVNEVRVPDGQTIILGGLRQKSSNDFTEAVPFLGELPGIGKFFSITELADSTTEMFIFLTPKIIYDPVEDLERLKCLEMARRPGDLPEFLAAIVEAQEWEREHLVQGSMKILLGRPRDRLIVLPGEWDGR